MDSKPTIPKSEVEKAQALARYHVGQAARAKGYDPAALRALAQYGKATTIGEGENVVTLMPQTLQIQLCLMEHSKFFTPAPTDTVADGIERMAHMAFIYSDPDQAFDILTLPGTKEEVCRDFRRVAFTFAKYFAGEESINKLTAHITAQMQLTDDAAGDNGKKPPAVKSLGGRKRR